MAYPVGSIGRTSSNELWIDFTDVFVEVPIVGKSSIFEGQARGEGECPRGVGNQDLVLGSRHHDALRVVYRPASDVAAYDLNLSNMYPAAHGQIVGAS